MSSLIERQAAIEAVRKAKSIGQAHRMLLQLPSAQPGCEDAVSRFEVLRLIDYSSNDLNDSVDNWYFQGKVKELPPVTPKQPGWIPTSVKPPEPFKLVLIQDSCGCYELNTYIPPRINPKQYPNGYWGEVGNVDFDYFDVEAWCPLPAPYRPEGEEHGKD